MNGQQHEQGFIEKLTELKCTFRFALNADDLITSIRLSAGKAELS